MRRWIALCLAHLALIVCYVPASRATEALNDVVYLKNGNVIRGTLIEFNPNESVKIQTADGSVFVWQLEEIEKVAKEPAFAPLTEPRTEQLAARRLLEIPAKKSPSLAVALSFLVTGGGQIYNGQPGKGFALMGVAILGFGVVQDGQKELRAQALILPLAAWLWSLADASAVAHRKNHERETLLTETGIPTTEGNKK